MIMTDDRRGTWRTMLFAALMIGLLGLAVVAASAAEATESRLDRKVRVMEKVIDEVLVQSPNILVSPGGTARGLVLEEFGALFTIEGSLGGSGLIHIRGIRVPRAPAPPDGSRNVIIVPDVDHEEGDEGKSWEEMEREAEERSKEMLAGLKTELIDTLIDYGATLGELGNDQWVAIAAFLDSREFLGSGDSGKRLILKARMKDLRQVAAGSLSRDAAISKIVVDER
jgi:hypothetical protein